MFSFLKKKNKLKEEKQVKFVYSDETKSDDGLSRGYKLNYSVGADITDIPNPTADDYEKAFDVLDGIGKNMVIVESGDGAEKFAFIRPSFERDKEKYYCEYEKTKISDGKKTTRLYSTTIECGAVGGIIDLFCSGKAPDVSGWHFMIEF
jgi:hypothetical protein